MYISNQYSSTFCLTLKQEKFYLKEKKSNPWENYHSKRATYFWGGYTVETNVLLCLAETSRNKTFVLFVLQHFTELQSLVHFEFMLNEA